MAECSNPEIFHTQLLDDEKKDPEVFDVSVFDASVITCSWCGHELLTHACISITLGETSYGRVHFRCLDAWGIAGGGLDKLKTRAVSLEAIYPHP